MDPSYPSVPVTNFIAAFFALLTFLTSMRQTWNAGVLMLCAWLFLYCLIQGVETIVWSDNADNKAPVWCDISSRLGIGMFVGVPACSFVITRRLCNIARLRTVERPTRRQRRSQFSVDIFIAVGIPILVMGPFYFVVEARRFKIIEEVGCGADEVPSGLATLLVDLWPVLLPLVSAVFYCPQIVWTFYHHHRGVNAFLRSNRSVNHDNYFRILAVGCLDIILTLPTGAAISLQHVAQSVNGGQYRFYPGWYETHHPWDPISVSANEWRSDFWERFKIIFETRLYPVLSILIFGVFGLTAEARATYRRWFWFAVGLFGFKRTVREDTADLTFVSSLEHGRTNNMGHRLFVPKLTTGTVDSSDLTISTEQSEHPGRESDSTDEIVVIWREECDSIESHQMREDMFQTVRVCEEGLGEVV